MKGIQITYICRFGETPRSVHIYYICHISSRFEYEVQYIIEPQQFFRRLVKFAQCTEFRWTEDFLRDTFFFVFLQRSIHFIGLYFKCSS